MPEHMLRRLSVFTLTSCLLFAPLANSQAQETLDSDVSDLNALNLDEQIAAAKSHLSNLDGAAQRCLAASAAADSEDSTACEEFREAISASQLSNYQSLCAPLIVWREQLISENAADNSENAELTLQRLLDTEFACGEKALVNRTTYVADAYAAMQNRSGQSSALVYTSGASQTDRNSYDLRQSVINSVDQNRSRLSRETDRQWQRLELENTLRIQQRLKVDLRNPSLQ